jgi:hypothetical protein
MIAIPSSGAAMWLPATVSAISQDTSNWISQSLDPNSQSAALQDFMDTSAAVADALSGAQANQAQGLAALAIQAATARIKGDLGKQIGELGSATSAPSIPYVPPTIYLADGSILNAAKNTFTLADGTVLDITTGMKVAGVVVDVTA